MTNPIRSTQSHHFYPPSNDLQNSLISPSSLDCRSTLLSSRQSIGINFFDSLVERLLNLWRWILNYFSSGNQSSSTSQINSGGASCVQNMIDFGNHFITRVLQEDNVREYANPSFKIAIIAKLNQQVVSQHLTVATLATLPAVRQLAIQQLKLNLERHGQNHCVNPSDELKVETYFLKPSQSGLNDIKYEFSAQRNGCGHDTCRGLPRADSIRYFHLKFGPQSTYRDDFIRFMTSA